MEPNVPLVLVLGFLGGIGFVYLVLRYRRIVAYKLDGHTLLLRLPLLGTLEVRGPEPYQGLFLQDTYRTLDKMKSLQQLMDSDLMIKYAKDFGINYIGFEGLSTDGSWSKGRLAYSTFAPGDSGGYNIFLNPDLDRKLICRHLGNELGLDIQADELYAFLFLHEIGHTRQAGNECYITARIRHRLGGKKRKRRKDMQMLYRKVEEYADDFAIKELSRWRELGKVVEK